MKKKKLLVFHPTIAPYRIDFFNSLYEAFDTQVCLFNADDKTFDYEKIYSQLLFQPVFLDKLIKIKDSYFNKGYWKWLDEFHPDIVIVSEFGVGTLQVILHRKLKKRDYKIVSICDDSINMLADGNDFSRIHRCARKWIAPQMDEIVLVEPASAEWYKKHYHKGVVFPIIRKEDRQRYLYEKVFSKSIELQQQYQLRNRNVFLFVGRLVDLKNVKTLINSFSKLDQSKNTLVIIGSGDEEERLRQQTIELRLDNVLFTGRLEGEKLYAWYNVADYFVLTSYQEAFGAVTNEALLAGCYSLISNKAGSNCLIKEGMNGFTFSPLDVDELSEKMRLLIETFPKKRPLISVKDNLMTWNYQTTMEKLISHLNTL